MCTGGCGRDHGHHSQVSSTVGGTRGGDQPLQHVRAFRIRRQKAGRALGHLRREMRSSGQTVRHAIAPIRAATIPPPAGSASPTECQGAT